MNIFAGFKNILNSYQEILIPAQPEIQIMFTVRRYREHFSSELIWQPTCYK